MQIFIYAVIIVSLFLITLSLAGAQEQPKGGFDYYGAWHVDVDQSKADRLPERQGSKKNRPHHAHPRCGTNAAGKWVCKR